MNRDWTKNTPDVPFYKAESKKFFMNFQSSLLLDNTSISVAVQKESKKAYRDLLGYFNKDFSNSDINDLYENYKDQIKYYLDPRSPEFCSGLFVLIIIDEEKLESFSDANVSELELNTDKIFIRDFEDIRSSILSGLNFVLNKMEKNSFSLYRDKVKISFEKIIENFKNFYSNFKFTININFEQPVFVNIFYNDEFEVRFLKNGLGDVGAREISSIKDDFLSFRLLLERERFENFQNENWQESFLNIVGDQDLSFKKNEDSNSRLEKLLQNYNINLESVSTEFLETLKRLKRGIVPEFKRCDIDYSGNKLAKKLYKNNDAVEREAALIRNNVFRGQVFDASNDVTDFVGDAAFEISNAPRDLDDLYSEILNRISIDTLVTKAIDCLLQNTNTTLPQLCVEAYSGFTIDLPAIPTTSFPGVFSTISKLSERALYFIITKALYTIIQEVYNLLDECENQSSLQEFIEEFGKIPEESLGTDYNSIVDNIGKKYNIDSKSFLDDLFSILSLKEICKLFDGESSENTYRIVSCMINIKYATLSNITEDKVVFDSYFRSIGRIANLEDCSSQLADPVPSDSLICDNNSARDAREILLKDNYDISEEEILKQLDNAVERRAEEMEFFENLTSDSLNPEKIQSLINDRLPTVENIEAIDSQARLALRNNFQQANAFLDSYLPNLKEIYSEKDFIQEAAGFLAYNQGISITGDIRDFNSRSGDVYSVKKSFRPSWVDNQIITKGGITYTFDNTTDKITLFHKGQSLELTDNYVDNRFSNTESRKESFKSQLINYIETSSTVPNIDIMGRYTDVYENLIIKLENILLEKTAEFEVSFSDIFIEDIEESNYNFIQNCWEGKEDMKVGAVERFRAKYNDTPDPDVLSEVFIAASSYYAYRFSVLDFYYKFSNLIDFEELYGNNKFIPHLIKNSANNLNNNFDEFAKLEEDATGQYPTQSEIVSEQIQGFKEEYNINFESLFARLFFNQFKSFEEPEVDLDILTGTTTNESLDNEFYTVYYFEKENGEKISIQETIAALDNPLLLLNNNIPEEFSNGKWVAELRLYMNGILNAEDLNRFGIFNNRFNHLNSGEFAASQYKVDFDQLAFNSNQVYNRNLHKLMFSRDDTTREILEHTFPLVLLFEIFVLDLYLILDGADSEILDNAIETQVKIIDSSLNPEESTNNINV